MANLGVLVGLFFLITELNQSNRIATYSAESTRITQYLDMNTSRIENPEIIAKLMHPDPAGVAARANEREKLECLCRYMARPAVSTKRLSLTPQRSSPL